MSSPTESSVAGSERSDAADESEDSWLDGVQSVADGFAFSLVGKTLLISTGFLLNLVLTRTLGLSLYGVFTFGQKLTATVLMFANCGSDISVMKFVSANTDDPDQQRQFVGLSYATALLGGGLVAAVLFVGAPTINAWTLADARFETALRIFALAIPFQALTNIAINSFRGLERAGAQVGMRVLTPISQLVGVVVAVGLGYSLYGIVVAFATGTALAFCLSFATVLRRTHLRPTLGQSPAQIKAFLNASIPFTFSDAGAVLYRRTDIFMVGLLLTTSAVGIYNVALLVGSVITMPLVGLSQLFPSVASRLYAAGEHETLEAVYTTITRWSITAALPIAFPLIVYREEVLSVFGEELVAGSALLVVFAIGQLINAAAGPSNDVLTMTDHQYLVMVNHWVFGVANVLLNYVLITQMGVIGAAIATATILALVNIARVLEVWYLTGLFAYTTRLWKPAVAITIGTGVMLGCASLASGLVLLFAGGAAGVGTYALVLVALGIDDRDRQVANKYVPIGD